DRNPFVSRPERCRFALKDGRPVDHRLAWRSIATRDLETIVRESARPAKAGMRVAQFAGGYWIGIETFSNAAVEVVSEVQARQELLRNAPMVVIDLRGNGGGNSQYAAEVAQTLVGDARAHAAGRSASACSGAYWRASAGNAAAL